MYEEKQHSIADIGYRSSANGQPVAGKSSSSTADESLKALPFSAPLTQPAQSAPAKQKLDRSQFVSKSQPATAPSGAKQTKFPVRKPGSKLFFRASSGEDNRLFADIVEGNMGKVYVVGVNVTRDARLGRFISQALLVPCVNEKGQAFVWYVKTASREWYRSALEMIDEAETRWIRIEPDSFAQAYKLEDASVYPELAKAEPNWPLSPSEILDDVLSSTAISDDNDPVLVEFIGKYRMKKAS